MNRSAPLAVLLIRAFVPVLFLAAAHPAAAFWPFSSKKEKVEDRTVKEVEVRVDKSGRDRKIGSFAPMIKAVSPSVVSIITTRAEAAEGGEDPLRRFFEDPEGGGRPRPLSLGSGVIISADGYIITNHHVVDGADEIKVAFSDGQPTEIARMVGADPKTDLAVLKVEGRKLLPAVLADSDQVEVGDIVLAIGNPFGLSQTVTSGIVSALGRGIGILQDGYEDFIQTDASINPGNSGGALIDIDGRVIGINTAIYSLSQSGGNQGIGFAVPINLARNVMEQIINNGRVVRGYIGVKLQSLDDNLSKAFDLPPNSGAIVSEIVPGSPAAEAGLKPGDILTEIDGRKFSDPRVLRLTVSQTPPGTRISLKYLREGKERSVTFALKELPETVQPAIKLTEPSFTRLSDGVRVVELDPLTRQQLSAPDEITGVVVREVDFGSPAFDAGLRAGDIIMSVNRRPVKTIAEAVQAVQQTPKDTALLHVWSKNGSRFTALPLEAKKATR